MLTVTHPWDGIISHLGLCLSRGPAMMPERITGLEVSKNMISVQFMSHAAYCIPPAHSAG